MSCSRLKPRSWIRRTACLWAVEADYFAWRVISNDLTGITGPEENEKGLEDARLFLAADALNTTAAAP